MVEERKEPVKTNLIREKMRIRLWKKLWKKR